MHYVLLCVHMYIYMNMCAHVVNYFCISISNHIPIERLTSSLRFLWGLLDFRADPLGGKGTRSPLHAHVAQWGSPAGVAWFSVGWLGEFPSKTIGTGIVLVIFGLRQVMVGILIRKHMEATSINQSIPRQSSPMWYWYHYQSMSHYHYHQSMVPV